jgi:hypothetical protein
VQDYLPSDGDKPITINLSFDSTDNSDEVEGLSSSFTVTSVDSNVGLSAPGGLSAVVPTTIAGQVNLSWSGSSENIDNYTIYWTDNTSLTIDPDNASTYLGSYTTTSTSPTSYSVTNLTNSLQHGFTLVANNSGGRSPVATPDNATPLVPTPSGLSTTVGMGTGQVDLSWSAVSGADNYTIYISTDNITFNPLSPAVTGTSYSSTTLDNGTALSVGSSYSYYIVANGGGGSSANSTIVSATPVVANVVRSANGLRFNDVELYPDGSAVATGEWATSSGFTFAPYSLGNLTVSKKGFMVAKTENGDWSWVWQPDRGHRDYSTYVYRGFLVSELAALPDGSVLMAGRAQGGSGNFKANDKSGNTITYPCIDDGDALQDLCATNAFVGKLDKDGKLLWASSVAAGTAASGLTGDNGNYMHVSAHSAVEAIALAPDGGSFVLGWLQHYTDLVFPTATDNVTLSFANYRLNPRFDPNNNAAFLGKLDSAGNWVWVKLISGNTHSVKSVKGKSDQTLDRGWAIETGPGPNLLDVSPDGSVVIAFGSSRPYSCYSGCTDNYTVTFGDPSLGDNFTFTQHDNYDANARDRIIITKFLDNGSFAWAHDTGVYYRKHASYGSGVHVHALRDNSTLLVNYRDDNVTIESKVRLKKLAGDGTVVENQEPNFYLASQQGCSSGGFNNVKVDQGRMEYRGNPAGPLTCHSMAVTPDESAIWLMCESVNTSPMGMFKFDISSNFGTRLSGRNIRGNNSGSGSGSWGDFSSVLPDGNAAALINIFAWTNGGTPLPKSFTIDSYDSSGCKVAEQTYQNTENFSRESFLLRFNTNDNGSWTNWSPLVNTPSVPQNLTATQGATGEIQLNWDALSRNELASYEIYRRDLGGATVSPTVVDLNDNKISVSPSNHLDSSLTSGDYFNYAVRAVNLSDNSSLSSPVGNVQAP